MTDMQFHPGPLEQAVTDRLDGWQNDGFVRRMWEKDWTLWSSSEVPELSNRLGWLDLPARAHALIDDANAFANEISSDGIQDIVLLGMGGSSLAPEVFQFTFGNADRRPPLRVLDSTHPDAVRRVAGTINPASTLFIVSSKSGGTIETMSFFHYFWNVLKSTSGQPGRHFVAITDPGSSLEKLAAERGFRRTFLAPEDVGGRYSALCEFGLVPAACIGVDIRQLTGRVMPMGSPEVFTKPAQENSGLVLGALIGEAYGAGRDKLTLIAGDSVGALPAWIEQLVAESTGKIGRGIVPVTGEPLMPPDRYDDDRVFVFMRTAGENAPDPAPLINAGFPVVQIEMRDVYDIGREFYRWEVATAVAGVIMGVQPFDQPDVQLAKDFAKKAMAGEGASGGEVTESGFAEAITGWLGGIRKGDYISVHAYLAPGDAARTELNELTRALQERTGLPATFDFGPRFLHSSGQLHKGGADNGLFLQIIDTPSADVPVPTTDYTFGQLIAAQAEGDAAALRSRGRRLLRVRLGADPGTTLSALAAAVS